MKNTSKFVGRFYEMRNVTNMLFNYMINQQIHFCKYVQSHIIISSYISIHQHSVTSVSIIKMTYNNNTTNIQ
jgi:hypothetical protein